MENAPYKFMKLTSGIFLACRKTTHHIQVTPQSVKMYGAVILQAHRKKLAVQDNWIEEKKANQVTKVFLSKNEQKSPDFTLPVKFFEQNEDSVHNAIYIRSFGKKNYNFRKNITLQFDHSHKQVLSRSVKRIWHEYGHAVWSTIKFANQ